MAPIVSKDERIDLTQFEGITPTQWRVDYEAVGDTKTVLYVKSDMTAHDNFVIAVLEDAPNGEYTEADANAIAAVPDLIAELKRYYERQDEANEAMLSAREVLMKHHEWMSMNDATSEEDDQEILDVVKALREASE